MRRTLRLGRLYKIDLKAAKVLFLPEPLPMICIMEPAPDPFCHDHVLMTLPVTGEDLQPLYKEILSFLYLTKMVQAETFQKRRL